MEQQVIRRQKEQIRQQRPNLTGIPSQMKGDSKHDIGLSFEDVKVRYDVHLPQENATSSVCPVMQLFTDEEVDTLHNRFAQRGWKYPREYCCELLTAVDRGETPRIGNHFCVLQRTQNGILRIIYRRFNGEGMLGRVGGNDGANYQVEDLTGTTNHNENIPNYFRASVRLDRTSLQNVPPRKPLNTVMGSSASELSTIVAAEYLHMIAHQLGGGDVPENLIVGTHALNTAMIPIENLVHDFVMQGLQVDYTVQFFPRPGPEIWTDAVEIDLTVIFRDGSSKSYWVKIALEENHDPSKLISQNSFNVILEFVKNVKDDVQGNNM